MARSLVAAGLDVYSPSSTEWDLLAPFDGSIIPAGTDVLVHCAATRSRSDAGRGGLSREIAMNVSATARLYEAALERKVRRVVHLSTLSVLRLGDEASVDLPDDAVFVEAPTHPYALTKRWGEELVVSLREEFEAIAIVRPGMSYGPRMQPSSGMGRVAARIRSGAPYPLAAPDGHRYAPVFIDDVVDVIVRLATSTSNVTVNVAGEPVWERQLAADVARWMGTQLRIETDASERPRSVVPSTRSLDYLFPDRVRTDWERGSRLAFGDDASSMLAPG